MEWLHSCFLDWYNNLYIYTRHSLQGRDKAISGKDERNTRANVISNRDSYDVRAGKNRDKRRVEGYSIRDRESENTGWWNVFLFLSATEQTAPRRPGHTPGRWSRRHDSADQKGPVYVLLFATTRAARYAERLNNALFDDLSPRHGATAIVTSYKRENVPMEHLFALHFAKGRRTPSGQK